MKLQWSIQSSHTQLVLSQVVYLNYRNEYIWPPTRKWLHNFETFHLASLQFITFDHFESIHLIFEIDAWNFWYFNLMNKFLAFGHHIFSIGEMLSLFLNQILVCAMAFAAHYLFSFWNLFLLSSLSKNNLKCGKIYKNKSMQVSKPSRQLTNHSWQAWRSIYNNHT